MSKTINACELHKVHHPSVTVLHSIDVDGDRVTVCGTGVDNLNACLAYMRGGESPQGPIGKPTWDLAQRMISQKV